MKSLSYVFPADFADIAAVNQHRDFQTAPEKYETPVAFDGDRGSKIVVPISQHVRITSQHMPRLLTKRQEGSVVPPIARLSGIRRSSVRHVRLVTITR
ncbi:MAG: hypothetical protein JWQ89_4520, partial [Devosia sp.]|nr:hypothetical protein [Devosia sp.]